MPFGGDVTAEELAIGAPVIGGKSYNGATCKNTREMTAGKVGA